MFFPYKKILFLFLVYTSIAIVFQTTAKVEGYVRYRLSPIDMEDEGTVKEKSEHMIDYGYIQTVYGDLKYGNDIMDESIAIEPTADKYQNKASANAIIGNYGEAIKAVDKAIELGRYASYEYKIWMLFFYLHDYEAALETIEEFEKNSSIQPVITYFMHISLVKGMLHKELHHYDKALEHLDYYIDLKQGGSPDVYAYYYRALTLLETEQFELALEDAESFIADHPKGPEGYYVKGLALNWLEKKEEACQNLQKSLDLVKKGYARYFHSHEITDQLYSLEVAEIYESICEHIGT